MTELKPLQPLRRGKGRMKLSMRLYVGSMQCRKCDRDYLYPGYGTENRMCNDCIMTYAKGFQ